MTRTRFVRLAGLLTILGALVGAVIEFILALTHPAILHLGFSTANILGGIAGGCLILVLLTGVVGLLRSGAAGDRGLGVIGLSVTLLSFPLLGMVAISEGMDSMNLHGLIRLVEGLNDQGGVALLLYPLLFGILGLLIAGVAVLRTRRWSGWRFYVPLLIGLYPLLSILLLHPSLLPSMVRITYSGRNQLGHWLGAFFFLCWHALGVALRTEGFPQQEMSRNEGPILP